MNKREFLRTSVLAGISVPAFLESIARSFESGAAFAPAQLAGENEFWEGIREQFLLKNDYINLENGYYCMMPKPLLERYLEHVRRVNQDASWYMRRVQDEDKRRITGKLELFTEASPGEVVITRNTTESLDLVIGGLPWKKNDEAIVSLQDYGSMLDMFDLVRERHGIRVKSISLPNHPKDDDELLKLYESEITSRTRLIMLCHMVNISGQILPVRKISDMAHRHGVEVMVDGAHSLAHIPVSMPELNCDYFGSSLHKWLQAPLGNGLLFVRKDKISKLSPLMAESPKDPADITRLNHTGTTPVHSILGIEDALAYHELIGHERKTARLRYLQQYWTNRIREVPGIQINTPAEPERSAAIANVWVINMDPNAMAEKLLKKYGIWTVAIDRPGVRGCRITPNIYTTTNELDQLVSALLEMAAS